MARALELGPGDYLIIDESDLHDFTATGDRDAAAARQRIEELYGIGGAEAGSGRLVDILAAIAERRRVQ